jgi:hypothetical protein
MVQLTPGQTAIDDQSIPWPYVASTPDEGCVCAGSARDRFSGQPTGPIALVLYRAGVLLAVNDLAHGAVPSLPMASDHERSGERRRADQPPVSGQEGSQGTPLMGSRAGAGEEVGGTSVGEGAPTGMVPVAEGATGYAALAPPRAIT